LLLTAKEKSFILLDEITSALDPQTSKDIVKLLQEFLRGKTTLIITHKMELLALADTVLDLGANGNVVAREANISSLSSSSQTEKHIPDECVATMTVPFGTEVVSVEPDSQMLSTSESDEVFV